jgi:hypothetical protein
LLREWLFIGVISEDELAVGDAMIISQKETEVFLTVDDLAWEVVRPEEVEKEAGY